MGPVFIPGISPQPARKGCRKGRPISLPCWQHSSIVFKNVPLDTPFSASGVPLRCHTQIYAEYKAFAHALDLGSPHILVDEATHC